MKTTISLFIILFLAFNSLVFAGVRDKEITAEDCKACDLDCSQRYHPLSSYILLDNSVTKKLMIFFDSEHAGAQNGKIIVFLFDGSTCRAVLNGDGSAASFEEKSQANYPDIFTYWHMSASEGIQTKYVWNGKAYEDVVRKTNIEKGKSLNDEALRLFSQKKIEPGMKIFQPADRVRRERPAAHSRLAGQQDSPYEAPPFQSIGRVEQGEIRQLFYDDCNSSEVSHRSTQPTPAEIARSTRCA